MRNKEVVIRKMEKVTTLVQRIGFHINKGEKDISYKAVGIALAELADVIVLVEKEQ